MKVNFAHLCDYALVANKKLSVLGIFKGVLAPRFPWSHPTLYIAFEIGLEPAEVGTSFSSRVDIRDEDGDTLLSLDGQVKTKGTARIGDYPTSRQVLCINGLTFPKAGRYEVNIWLGKEHKYRLPFDVTSLPARGSGEEHD